MRGAPQPGFSLLRRRMRSRTSRGTAGRPALPFTDLPRPEEAKCVAVPRNDCFGLDDDQRRTPVLPDAGQPDPQETVGSLEPWALLRGALKDVDLMPQCNVLELQCSFSEPMRLRRGRVQAIWRSNRGLCGSQATSIISAISQFAIGTVNHRLLYAVVYRYIEIPGPRD